MIYSLNESFTRTKNPPKEFYDLCHKVLEEIRDVAKKNISDIENELFVKSFNKSDRAIEDAKWDNFGYQGYRINCTLKLAGWDNGNPESHDGKFSQVITSNGFKQYKSDKDTTWYYKYSKTGKVVMIAGLSINNRSSIIAKNNSGIVNLKFICADDSSDTKKMIGLDESTIFDSIDFI